MGGGNGWSGALGGGGGCWCGDLGGGCGATGSGKMMTRMSNRASRTIFAERRFIIAEVGGQWPSLVDGALS